MTPEDFTKLEGIINASVAKGIAIGIEKNVNGKINGMRAELQTYIADSATWRDGIEAKINPVSTAFTNATLTARVLIGTTKALAFGAVVTFGVIVLSYSIYEAATLRSIKPLISAFKSFI